MAYVRRLTEEEQRLPQLDLRVAVDPERWEPTDPREFWNWRDRPWDRPPEWLQMVQFLALVLVPILVALIGAYFDLRAWR